jgi:hypothetical protein
MDVFIGRLKNGLDMQRVSISLIGTFNEVSINEKDFLFQNKFQLLHVCNPLEKDNLMTRTTFQNYSEYGFKIPIVWYFTSTVSSFQLILTAFFSLV